MSETKIEVNSSSCNNSHNSSNCNNSSKGNDECHCKCHHKVPVTLRDHFWRDPFFSSNWEDFDKIRHQVRVALNYPYLWTS